MLLNQVVVESKYGRLLSLPHWKSKRNQILLRDGNKCRSCGSNNSLQVHHRQYHVSKKTGEFLFPWKYQNKYLITLCEKCHSAGHANYKVPTFNI
jgi:5-methylcytosine-specific restriction endonuclease McrA